MVLKSNILVDIGLGLTYSTSFGDLIYLQGLNRKTVRVIKPYDKIMYPNLKQITKVVKKDLEDTRRQHVEVQASWLPRGHGRVHMEHARAL